MKPAESGAKTATFEGWTIWEYEELPSTNDAAAALPPWSAVRASRQTSGRGRHQRGWVSDPGGLWMSAVVPGGPEGRVWPALPLVVGLVVCEALCEVGARNLRLRWPNDVMLGRLKLAGLLVDHVAPGKAVVGIGINVENQPDRVDPGLAGEVIRLADLVSPLPDGQTLMRRLLKGLRQARHELEARGFETLVDRVNDWWQIGVPMDIETDGGQAGGAFLGVDSDGRLRVADGRGGVREWAAHQVIRVRERTEERWL